MDKLKFTNHFWICASEDIVDINIYALSKKQGISRPLMQFFLARGVASFDSSKNFFYKTEKELSDSFLLDGMQKSVMAIWKAIQGKKEILLFADADTDGIAATVLLKGVLRDLHAKVRVHLPRRFDDKLVFSLQAIKECFASQESLPDNFLMITLDCGVSCPEAVSYAVEHGADVIITDHHVPKNQSLSLPVIALINPKTNSTPIPQMKYLTGVGVAFKLAEAVLKYGKENLKEDITPVCLDDYFDLVALGTIADRENFYEDNYVFLKKGMDSINRFHRIGLAELCKEFSLLKHNIKPNDIMFKIAPVLNTSGRFGCANLALELLSSMNSEQVSCLLKQILQINQRRYVLMNEMEQMIETSFHSVCKLDTSTLAVFSCDIKYRPIAGVFASKLSYRMKKTIFILLEDGNKTYIIGRTDSKQIDLEKMIQSCSELPIPSTANANAIGFHVATSHVSEVVKKLYGIFSLKMQNDLFEEPCLYDGESTFAELDADFCKLIDEFGPFGKGNPYPVYMIKNVYVSYLTQTSYRDSIASKGEFINSEGKTFHYVSFKQVPPENSPLDIMVCPHLFQTGFRQIPQLILIDYRIHV